MFSSRWSKAKHAISRAVLVTVVVIVIIIIAAGAYIGYTRLQHPSSSSSSTTSSVVTSSGSTTVAIPSSFTYETASTPEWLDPQVSYFSYDFVILQNVYESLLAYNGPNSTQTIPWLASNYTLSSIISNGTQKAYFTLRPGITFADGEPLNSTAVYFAFNKLLVDDSTSPTGHNSQGSWIIQQLANKSLSSVLSGTYTTKNAAYVSAVLAENFIEITGQYTFTMNIQNPNSALPYLLAAPEGAPVAPNYVMQQDLALWNSTSGYTLPYPKLSGGMMNRISQYLDDFAATCDTNGNKGCGTTYLDHSTSGSLAGTGPYEIQSVNPTSNDIVLVANPNYWGGAYQYVSNPAPGFGKITPQIKTIYLNYVPDDATRTLDLKSAASSGKAMAIDLVATHLYDFANRDQWLSNGTLSSVVSGVSLFGPTTAFSTLFDPFTMNATNPQTGRLYTFQPFSDRRFRLAFADAANLTEVNIDVNNRLGVVAQNMEPPGLPPNGVYDPSITPDYNYNIDAVQSLLLSAMENPVTSFVNVNGVPYAPGVVNNTFGCTAAALNSNGGTCPGTPTTHTINLYYGIGDVFDEALFTDIATAIDNVSATYNMGLSVAVTPEPTGFLVAQSLAGYYPLYALGWFADYPWVYDFDLAAFGPSGSYSAPDGWNITQMHSLIAQEATASSQGNLSGVIAASHAMNALSNSMVQYIWTLWSYNIMAITSNVHGYYFNAALSTSAGGIAGPQYFATYY
jgi:ABC-type transport system substrate-binding protein